MERRKRASYVSKRNFLFLIPIVITVTFVCIFSTFSIRSDAAERPAPVCCYTPVRIRIGDSLSSIAREYNTTGYYTDGEYIEKVKEINSLSSDTIHAGCYLTVVIPAAEN